VIDDLRKMLERHEGVRLKAYKDTVGKTTIGVGRNLDDRGITRAEAFWLLDNDIARVLVELDEALPWWRTLNEARMVALADMCFQLGLAGLLEFQVTLKALQFGDYQGAAWAVMQSLYAKQTPNRAREIAEVLRSGRL